MASNYSDDDDDEEIFIAASQHYEQEEQYGDMVDGDFSYDELMKGVTENGYQPSMVDTESHGLLILFRRVTF